ncbi:hypothetical protein KAX02_00980 [candidate division WOR-3 bacterium]|nr:hypothetical protein [candidate division WOR-3 bacterium]
MDKFTLIIGIIGLILLFIGLVKFISAIVNTIKRKRSLKSFLSSFIIFLILLAFASSFLYLSLFLQTFSRYTHEERIGKIYIKEADGKMILAFFDEKKDQSYVFDLSGDQWMVEGYILRWSLLLRWIGAGYYYRITRFSGRWKETRENTRTTTYQIHPGEKLWEYLLKYADKIPLVDAAYGIAAFQYPSDDTFYLYINDTGFILRTR